MTLLCFSHLRWNFVYQRPQHLMSRFASQGNIYFIEEPLLYDYNDNYLIQSAGENVHIVVPHLNKADKSDQIIRLKNIIDKFLRQEEIENYIAWYYTPMAVSYTAHLKPALTVYDCMDELSAFKFAPPQLKTNEEKLFQKADVVFTGGYSLYKAKKHLHHNIHALPSSIDKAHFSQARNAITEPQDQQDIPHPRLGFFGVIDERFDINLIKNIADAKPDWHFILIGPVVKINAANLPANSNIHYLGNKSYQQLPAYISGWNIAMIPFAINESTKYISPTKTPEYLAAGKPVISTAITDVIHPYHDEKLVHIIHSAEEFIKAADEELNKTSAAGWLNKTDAFLADVSWDLTWKKMNDIIHLAIQAKQPHKHKKQRTYV